MKISVPPLPADLEEKLSELQNAPSPEEPLQRPEWLNLRAPKDPLPERPNWLDLQPPEVYPLYKKDEPLYTSDPVFGLSAFPTYLHRRAADGKTVYLFYTTNPTVLAEENCASDYHTLNPANEREKIALEAFRYQISVLEKRYHMKFIDVSHLPQGAVSPDVPLIALWSANLSQCIADDGSKGQGAYATLPRAGTIPLVIDVVSRDSDEKIYRHMAHELGHILGEKHPFDSYFANADNAKSIKWGLLDPALDNPHNTVMSYNDYPVRIDSRKGYDIVIHGPQPVTFQPYDFMLLDELYELRPGQKRMKNDPAAALADILSHPKANIAFYDKPGDNQIEGSRGSNAFYDVEGRDVYTVKPGAANLFFFSSAGGSNIIRGLHASPQITQIIRLDKGDDDPPLQPHMYYDGNKPVITFSGAGGKCQVVLEEFTGNLDDLRIQGSDGRRWIPSRPLSQHNQGERNAVSLVPDPSEMRNPSCSAAALPDMKIDKDELHREAGGYDSTSARSTPIIRSPKQPTRE